MSFLDRLLGRQPEQRNDPGWYTRDDTDAPMGVGSRVTTAGLLSLTTVWRCVDLLASAVSQAPKDVIVKIGGKSFPEFQKPAWLEMPHGPGDPNYTSNDLFFEVALSKLIAGVDFTFVYPHVLDPQTVTVLDPTLVTVKSPVDFEVKDRQGKVIGVFGPENILYGTWIRLPGMLRGIAPLEMLRRSIGGAIAAEEHAARYFTQGATLSFGVEVPGVMQDQQKAELRNGMQATHAGLRNAHAIGVLTNGAKFVTGLQPTPEQAQMLATRQFSVEDLCRPFGIPPHMVGSQQPGAVSYASVNGTLLEFKQYAVLPLATRIEAQFSRLVAPPANLATGTAQFKFNLDGIARADLLTRYQAYKEGIQGGFLAPDEARTLEDYQPKGGQADSLFMQAQMVPIDQLGATVASGDTQLQPAARSIDVIAPTTIVSDVRLEAGVAAAITEHVTDNADANTVEAIAQTQRAASALDAKLGTIQADFEAKIVSAREALRAEFEADREARQQDAAKAIPPKRVTVAQRDERNRPLLIIEQIGDRTVRKMVERDDDGNILQITEVAAA